MQANLPLKINFLDQKHWIELAQVPDGPTRHPETPGVLEALRQARASGRACFPLSYAHDIETWKQRALDRRQHLATLM